MLLQAATPRRLRLWQLLVDVSTQLLQRGVRASSACCSPTTTSRARACTTTCCRRSSTASTRQGCCRTSDGAEVVFPPGFTNREGEPLPLIVQQARRRLQLRDQRPGLRARPRRAARAPTLLVYVVGAPQAQHLQMVFAVSRDGRLAAPAGARRARRLRQRARRRPQDVARAAAASRCASSTCSTRRSSGGGAVAEKNPDLPPRRAGGGRPRRSASAPLKYADLSTDRVKDYVFDWERMLSFDGNTAPYLQYAHARICSILRRAGVDPAALAGVRPRLGEPEERALALRLLGFDAAVQRDGRDLQPAPPVHLPLRAGAGLHRVLRGVPGARRPTRHPRPAAWRCATSRRGCSSAASACSASTPRSACDRHLRRGCVHWCVAETHG